MKTRIYLITLGGEERLVKAANAAQAIRHVASKTMNCRVASQDDLAELLTAVPPATIETAGVEDNE